MTTEKYVRVIVIEEEGTFIAQCLEYDICAHAQDAETVEDRFKALFNFERNLSIERSGSPFAGIGPAPQKFHDMWKACQESMDMLVAGAHISIARCEAA